jgi:glycosyltransferase involved in cell wall biosynthesis
VTATRLLIVMPWGQRLGGAENMLWLFLLHVDRSRFEPTVVFFEPGPFAHEVAGLGMTTHVVSTGRLRQGAAFVRATRALARIMRESKPGVILSWMAKSHVYAAPAAALARVKCPLIWWQHVVPAGHWMDRLAASLPTSAIGCSSERGALAQQDMVPRRPTFVVHPGIELPEPVSDGMEVRDRLGIPRDQIVAGIVGRLQPLKGQDRFLRAIRRVADTGVSLHGLVVGGDAHGLSPEYAQHIDRLITELSLSTTVTMTGQVPSAAPLLSAMDILVNASNMENFSLALLEGMAAGVPPIAVADGGSSEMIEHDVSGVLIATPDDELLSGAVCRLATDHDLRHRIALGARQRVAENFTATQMAKTLQDALEERLRNTPSQGR